MRRGAAAPGEHQRSHDSLFNASGNYIFYYQQFAAIVHLSSCS